jgi:hypothetical protein
MCPEVDDLPRDSVHYAGREEPRHPYKTVVAPGVVVAVVAVVEARVAAAVAVGAVIVADPVSDHPPDNTFLGEEQCRIRVGYHLLGQKGLVEAGIGGCFVVLTADFGPHLAH